MEDLWRIMSEWDGFGQGLFLLIVIGMFFALIHRILYYIVVSFRGWPPPGTPTLDEED